MVKPARRGRPYSAAHRFVTSTLTNEEHRKLVEKATAHGLPPTTYATAVLRKDLQTADETESA